MGPSGVGKTTLVNRLLQDSEVASCVTVLPSYTTRLPRIQEVNGRDYFFISPEEFEEKIKEGFFLEWSSAYGDLYGSSVQDVQRNLELGKSVVLVIDRSGAEQITQTMKTESVVIAIMPPNEETLRARLKQRAGSSEQFIQNRMQKSLEEIAKEKSNPLADYTVINGDLERAFQDLKSIIKNVIFNKTNISTCD